jgi:hypothetical protein
VCIFRPYEHAGVFKASVFLAKGLGVKVTIEGLVLFQSICVTYPVKSSPLVFELDEDEDV